MNARVRLLPIAAVSALPEDTADEIGTLRKPPHSLEAEQSVLGALLQDGAAFSDVAELVAEADFYRPEHRCIFAAVADLVAAGTPVDIVTVFEQLQGGSRDFGGLPYLNQLAASVISTGHARRHAEIVAKHSMLRQVIGLADNVATQAFRRDADPVALLDNVQSTIARIEGLRRNPGRRVPLLSLDRLAQASTQQRWLVKHVVPADAIGMLFGGSGTFKSFLALDLACHVAHGMPWMGRRTLQGPVIYIAAEGGTGLWKRIDGWHRARRARTAQAPLFVVPMALDLSADAWRVVEAAQGLGVAPALVVVDTLSQTYAGEENSANEMAAYLRELGVRFRALWGCSVLLIHHSGHAATERPRGSSAIRANVDFLLGVHRDEKEMLATLSCIKQKDGELFQDATFALGAHDLGNDADGDKVTTLVARHLSSAEEVTDAMQAEAQAGRAGKNQVFMSLVQNGMKANELRKLFADECPGMTEEARRQAWHRAKAWATSKGFIEIADGVVITTKPKGAA